MLSVPRPEPVVHFTDILLLITDCGNTIENNAQPITNCNILPMNGVIDTVLKRCTGNPKEFCGGSNIVSIYTLPGTGLIPLIPFGPNLNDLCSGEDCPGNE